MNFNAVKSAVAKQFDRIQSAFPLFRVEIDKDALWAAYLGAFPPGTNPILRERTEHDCSACRSFIRAVGDVVAVTGDGEIVSIWDTEVEGEPAYSDVCTAMSRLVKSKPIAGPFLHHEPTAGVHQNFEMDNSSVSENPVVKTWSHFFVNVDRRYVKPKADIPSLVSAARSTHDVLLRSLREITPEAVDTVLELIAQGSLYRGEEHQASVLQFQGLKRRFDLLAEGHRLDWTLYPRSDTAIHQVNQDVFAWIADVSGAVSRMRNTVIGTLLVDLSTGVDLEAAVRAFESKVAPTNYKRPTALVTKAMIEKAKEKIQELGLSSALDRRYATIRDISVEHVLFADRTARRAIAGDVFDELVAATGSRVGEKALQSLERVEEVPIDRFVAEIVPRAESIEVMFENRLAGNLVSLIAPCDPTARQLFKWGNLFSWSYAGELADAIKEKVKRAGGNVTGDLCCRLAWHNHDDLDLHMQEPGYHIYYADRWSSYSEGRLDVDMNVTPTTREPVENIYYPAIVKMREGVYHLFVNQYRQRESENVGFECEIDYLGTVHRFAYDKIARGDVTVARFRYTHKGGLEILESLPSTQVARTLWGIPTQTFHRVSVLLISPNHWDAARQVGNRHFFFMVEGCKNDGQVRGFYNEFLGEELTPHRKVFEVVGARMRPQESEEQLSGLGFSSTRRDTVVCRVRGSFNRIVKIVF